MSVDPAREQLKNLLRKAPGTPAEQGAGFDPADHTVADVQAHIEANPDERRRVLKAEKAGKARSTLVDWLGGAVPVTTINADLDTLRAWNGTVSNEANTVLRICLDVAQQEARDEMYDSHYDHPDVQLGIIMSASRYFKRRQSVEGVAGWGDLGAIRISHSDPDINRLYATHRDPCKSSRFGVS